LAECLENLDRVAEAMAVKAGKELLEEGLEEGKNVVVVSL
jgi:predicted dinucleotide-utilizing enzyme